MNERLDRLLELMGQQGLERRPAARALPRAPLGAVNPHRGNRDRLVSQPVRQAVAVRAIRDAGDDHRVDVEPEAERQHPATVARSARREQDRVPARYASGEEREVVADGIR